MIKSIENKISRIPIIKYFYQAIKGIKIPGLSGMSLYDIIEMYIIGIGKGALTSRAGGISYSFFMAIFPFLLFMFTLIPFIPIDDFQVDFMDLISELLPPKTFEVVNEVVLDISENRYGGLMSFGFIMSIFLMTNGVSAIFGGFEYSYHVTKKRNVFRSYIISIGISLIMCFALFTTISATILYKIGISKLKARHILSEDTILTEAGIFVLFIFMIFTIVSLLFYFGTREGKNTSFFSPGSTLTTFLYIVTFYIFGIYVNEFAKYNELYGAVGALLIIMLFIWLNSIILLLGFELNATIHKLKKYARRYV
ncbi:MAG: YihY/virulence factor BrkB family protein [Flavobacteriaceae bacterium]|nr:YihY/virulence factor BrkB family protein [Flavobacteriaceae bacterium]